jgi:hypothetical protein
MELILVLAFAVVFMSMVTFLVVVALLLINQLTKRPFLWN